MSPAPTARARPSPSCARSWKPRASACTSIPRRIWCASTSASGSARRARASWSRDDELAAALAECERANAGAPITVFEITTAAGMLLFARHPADVLLLEVGLGGRLDATNVIDNPLATVITPLSIDHADFLGDTLEKIAAEKAGILKRGAPAIIAAQARDALAVIERQAAQARRAAADRRRGLDRDRGTRPAGLSGRRGPARSAGAEALRPPSVRECRARDRGVARDQAVQACAGGFRGRHRQGRLAGAHAAAWRRAGWSRSRPPGSELWLDGGHNPDGGRAIAAALADLEERVSRPLVLIVGMLATKDCAGFLRNFTGLARRMIAVPVPGAEKGMTAEAVADAARAIGLAGNQPRQSRGGAGCRAQARSRSAAAHSDHRLALSGRRGAARERHAADLK